MLRHVVRTLRPLNSGPLLACSRGCSTTRLFSGGVALRSRLSYSPLPSIQTPLTRSRRPNGASITVKSSRVSISHLFSTTPSPSNANSPPENTSQKTTLTLRENIYTIPNFLTVTRILACPVIGWAIVKGDFALASGLVVYAGLTDLVDGFLARRYNMSSVLGSILDPAADKALMTTLTVALAVKGLLPVPLAVIILGRDVLLSISAFYYRYISLPAPKTFKRYWDFSIPSASVHPTFISKVNTALQLGLMTATVFNPILPYNLDVPLEALQWIVGTTTVWSGLSYVFSKDAVKFIRPKAK